MHPHTGSDFARGESVRLAESASSPSTGGGRRSPWSVRGRRLSSAGRLLGDSSSLVRRALLREFRSAGREGRPILRRALRSDDPHVRAHARSLLDSLDREEALRRLLRFAAREEHDLEAGLFRLSHLERGGLDLSPYRATLDELATELRFRFTRLPGDLERARALADYLGSELGLRGDAESEIGPDDVFVHRVLDRGRGLPLTLCAIYSFVASRCGLRTGLMPLPGHVMLRIHGRESNLILDPFNGGEVRTMRSLQRYLAQHGLRFRSIWFKDASATALLHRQSLNLRNALHSTGRYGRARRLDPLIELLGRTIR